MMWDPGLSYSDYDVIATLRRAGAPYELTPTELSKRVLLTSGGLTACLAGWRPPGWSRAGACPRTGGGCWPS